jgi:hypothetical protein
MNKTRISVLALFLGASSIVFAGTEPQLETPTRQQDPNSRDFFSAETTYTFSSDFKDSRFGDGDSFHNDFSYDHRFLITGKWYFRTGIEYERYDFDGTDNGLPDHLQALYGHFAVEYVVHDFPGVSIEIDPGEYFQNEMSGDAFDIPWKVFVSFPLKKDKIFGVIGLGGALYQDPVVAPGGGLIVLFSDTLRLLGVFPKPALVWEPNDDWQLKLLGELYYTSFRTEDVITPAGNFHLHNAVVQYSEDRAGAYVAYKGFKPFKIIAEGGYTLRRDFDFFRSNQSVKADPAPYVRFSIEAKF